MKIAILAKELKADFYSTNIDKEWDIFLTPKNYEIKTVKFINNTKYSM